MTPLETLTIHVRLSSMQTITNSKAVVQETNCYLTVVNTVTNSLQNSLFPRSYYEPSGQNFTRSIMSRSRVPGHSLSYKIKLQPSVFEAVYVERLDSSDSIFVPFFINHPETPGVKLEPWLNGEAKCRGLDCRRSFFPLSTLVPSKLQAVERFARVVLRLPRDRKGKIRSDGSTSSEYHLEDSRRQ